MISGGGGVNFRGQRCFQATSAPQAQQILTTSVKYEHQLLKSRGRMTGARKETKVEDLETVTLPDRFGARNN